MFLKQPVQSSVQLLLLPFQHAAIMTLYEFNALDEFEQTSLLWVQGAFVMDRQESGNEVLLYQLYGFYVEVYYQGELNKIQKLRSFVSTDPLEPYIENIDISPLFN